MGNGPDLDELPEVNQGPMGAPPVKTLQGLEGAVVRRHGKSGIDTSSSSSEGDLTPGERQHQELTFGKGRASAKRSLITAPTRKVSIGRAKPVNDSKVNDQPMVKTSAKVEDSVFVSVSTKAAETLPKPVDNTYPAPPSAVKEVNTATSANIKLGQHATSKAAAATEVKPEYDPYELKVQEHKVKGEPAKPAKPSVMSEEEEMDVNDEEEDVSLLRDNSDDEHDAISDTNLSDIQVVEEFPEVEEEKTERILEKMGTESAPAEMGVIELCDDIVMMLNPMTSTPRVSPARSRVSSTASTHSSMPPLESLSSSANDSGNASGNSNPQAADTAALDTVKVIWNGNDIYFTNANTNNSCSRNPTSQASERAAGKMISHAMNCSILQRVLLPIYYIYFVNVYFYLCSEYFRIYYDQKVIVLNNFALGNKT